MSDTWDDEGGRPIWICSMPDIECPGCGTKECEGCAPADHGHPIGGPIISRRPWISPALFDDLPHPLDNLATNIAIGAGLCEAWNRGVTWGYVVKGKYQGWRPGHAIDAPEEKP